MADWQKIKTEYITTQTSYRKLAQKYGVHYNAIANRAKQEEWVSQRNQYCDNTVAKTIDAISEQTVDRATRFQTVADKLLMKIEALVDDPEPMSTKELRALSAAMKDLKEIQGVKSELDRQEQEARIANLRKQADKDEDKTEEIEVVFVGGEEVWHG